MCVNTSHMDSFYVQAFRSVGKNSDGSGASLNTRELWLILLSSVGLPAPAALRVEP